METREVKLGDIVKYNKGYAFKSSEYTDEGVMVVRVTDFTLDSISDVDAVYLAPDDRYDKFILKTNDILIQTVGSWANNPNSIVGKVVRVPNQCDSAYLNQNIVRIIPNNDFDNTYLFYALRANQFSTYCVLRGQGAANQASITLDTIFRFKFKVHNFAEQKRIADILSAYDNLIENNNKRIKLLEQMAENLYKEWFVRFRFPGYEDMEFENGIPKGWEIKSIGKIGNVVGGGTPSTSIEEYWGGDIPWVTPADLSNYSYTFIKAGVKNITTLGLEKSSAKMLPQNTVLLSSRAPVGYVAIAANPICTNQGFKSVVCDTNMVEPYYLYFVLKSNRSLLEQYATGATFPELSASTFRKIKFLIPEISIQKSFANALKDIFKLSADLVEQNKCLMKQRDMLLPRLMSGKLEV